MRIKVLLTAAAVLVTLSGCMSQKTALWNGEDFTGWKLFLQDKNVDVGDVWSVRDGLIHCKGAPNGYMRTEADYSNYKLHVEWRWVKGDYKRRNSGVLLHMTGDDKVWPKSIEAQLHSGDAGDFWLINGTKIKIEGREIQKHGKYVRVTKKGKSSEKPIGQWNGYDIICEGDIIRCFVNGMLQNEGSEASVTSGKICLQSEGAPIEFRNIYIDNLD